MKRVFLEQDGDNYLSLDGWKINREYNDDLDNGDCFGHWVLRDPNGEMLDCDTYRYDLAERNDAVLQVADSSN